MLVYTRKICYRAVCILVYMLVHALVHTCLHSTLHSMCQHSLHAAFAIAVLPHFCTRKCLQLNLQTCWHDLWHTRSWILAYILWTESVCKLLYNTLAATLIKTIAFANKIWLHARCQIQFTCSGKKGSQIWFSKNASIGSSKPCYRFCFPDGLTHEFAD